MLIQRTSLLIFCLLSNLASAGELARLDRKVVAFQDQAAKDTLLLMSSDGRVDWLVGGKLTRKGNYRITDKRCAATTQNTTTMADDGGMTLVYPFLVGVQYACYFDEHYKTIRLLAEYKKDLPRNPYSLVYAGAVGDTVGAPSGVRPEARGDDQEVHFLINGRPFPDGDDGYLAVLTLSKKELTAKVREVVTGVPGFSGAMLSDGDSIWITTAFPNQIHQLLKQDLRAAIQADKKVEFSRLAKEIFHDIDGLSLFMLGNSKSLLYFNEEYGSYTVSRANGKVKVVKPPCIPIAGYAGGEDEWVVLCDGNRVETWKD